MDCPRCGLALSGSEYEGRQVQFCGECWGYWLGREQLDAIVGTVEYRFSRAEVEAVKLSNMIGDVDRHGSESAPVSCPECSKVMDRGRYRESCPVEIDECAAHGVWLDTGEIKDLQVFLERGFS